MEFGEILYSLRKKHNLSQKQLAEKLDVAQASINYWENGKRTPSIEAAQKISDYFGVTINDMLGGMIEQSKIQIRKTTSFYDYLNLLGYEIGQGEHEDHQMHIKETDTYIELSSNDVKLLKDLEDSTNKDIKRTIELLIATKSK